MQDEKELKVIMGANIRRRRLILGWDQSEVAERLGMSRPAYVNLEKGCAKIGDDLFALLQTVFSLSAEMLFAPAPRCVYRFFRKNARETQRERALIEEATRFSVGRISDYSFLERTTGKRPMYDGDLLKLKLLSGESIDDFALRVRRFLFDHGLDDLENLANMLEVFGIKVVCMPIPMAKCFGFSFSVDGQSGIFINTDTCISGERQLFTLAHELGHILLHRDREDFEKLAEKMTKAMEDEVNRFASQLLMPQKLFREAWDDTAALPWVERVLSVKRRFRVSYRMVLYRLSEGRGASGMSTVFAAFGNGYLKRWGHNLAGNIEPQPYPFVCFAPRRYSRLAIDAYKQKSIGVSKLAELLGKSVVETMDILNAEFGKVA